MNAKKRKRWIRRHGGSKVRPVAGSPGKLVAVYAYVTATGLKRRDVVERTIMEMRTDSRYDVVYIDR